MSVWRDRRDAAGSSSRPPLVIGHRGGRGEGFPTENTIAAFDHARAQGARAIELDVRLSRDGEVVVFHDRDLTRATGGEDPRQVEDLDWAELRAVGLRGGAAGDVGDAGRERMPLLADVLEWARATSVALNVELKRDQRRTSWPRFCRRVGRLVRDPRVDVLLSSFDPILIAMTGVIAPNVPRAWLTDPKESPPFDAMAFCARRPLVDAIHPRHDQVTAARVAACHARGTAVGVYTVNERGDAARLARFGVDWLITDRPGELGCTAS